MQGRTLHVTVLVAALTALVASIAWAGSQSSNDGWMMSRYGSGMMGYASAGEGEPVRDLAGARAQAQRFAERLDLEVGEVMRFERNYYAELEEDGRLATEVLIDPASGAVSLEYGPAMMWNTRFGMMSDYRLRDGGGMMGGGMMGSGMMGGDPSFAPTTTDGDVSAREAARIASAWLRRELPGTAVGEPDAFPGYYTLHVLRGGRVAGMLSVHATTGAVWYHSWHGRFRTMT